MAPGANGSDAMYRGAIAQSEALRTAFSDKLAACSLRESRIRNLLAHRERSNVVLDMQEREKNNCLEIVRLNVGGEMFDIPIGTLLSRDSDSYFHHLLNARGGKTHFPVTTDRSGVLFIDRDPQVFRHILNYLRGYQRFSMLSNEVLEMLKLDAKYYQLDGLEKLLACGETPSKLQFQSGPGVNPERTRIRVVYGVALVGERYLITGKHRITYEILRSDYIGIGLVSDACTYTDQEFHKALNCCVYYMTGVFYANFPHHRKEENLQKLENNDFITLSVDMDKRVAEYTLKDSTKVLSLGNARRVRFAVAMKLGSRVRIVADDVAMRLPMHRRNQPHAANAERDESTHDTVALQEPPPTPSSDGDSHTTFAGGNAGAHFYPSIPPTVAVATPPSTGETIATSFNPFGSNTFSGSSTANLVIGSTSATVPSVDMTALGRDPNQGPLSGRFGSNLAPNPSVYITYITRPLAEPFLQNQGAQVGSMPSTGMLRVPSNASALPASLASNASPSTAFGMGDSSTTMDTRRGVLSDTRSGGGMAYAAYQPSPLAQLAPMFHSPSPGGAGGASTRPRLPSPLLTASSRESDSQDILSGTRDQERVHYLNIGSTETPVGGRSLFTGIDATSGTQAMRNRGTRSTSDSLWRGSVTDINDGDPLSTRRVNPTSVEPRVAPQATTLGWTEVVGDGSTIPGPSALDANEHEEQPPDTPSGL